MNKPHPEYQDHRIEQRPLFYAHSANAAGQWHRLSEHLCAVAELASAYAENPAWAQEAALAGLLHDLGKYAGRFQARLEGKDSGLDHWSQGAWVALSKYHAIAASLAIQGHHVGLQRGSRDALSGMKPEILAARHPFNLQLSDPDAHRLVQRAQADGLQFNTPSSTAISLQRGFAQAVAAMLDVRLLFSCLVDADFLDTEAHFEGDGQGKRPRPAGPRLDLISVEVQQTAPVQGFRFPPLRALLRLIHCSAMTLPTRAWLLLNFDANQEARCPGGARCPESLHG